jgi:hypothetical protein
MLGETSAEVLDEDVLALKADLSIPWNKMRMLRRYVKLDNHTLILTYIIDG